MQVQIKCRPQITHYLGPPHFFLLWMQNFCGHELVVDLASKNYEFCVWNPKYLYLILEENSRTFTKPVLFNQFLDSFERIQVGTIYLYD